MTIKNFKVFGYFISLFLVFSFFWFDFVYAGYQKIAPGDTVTLGEFVFYADSTGGGGSDKIVIKDKFAQGNGAARSDFLIISSKRDRNWKKTKN